MIGLHAQLSNNNCHEDLTTRFSNDPVRFVRRPVEAPSASVIIPSLDGVRGGNLAALIRDLEGQSFQDFELLVVVGVSPNGRSRNVGAAAARGSYLIFIDDDVRLGHAGILEALLTALAQHEEFGLVGPSQRIPPDSTWLQHRMARQLPRTRLPVVEDFEESDMVSHMCLALRRSVWDEVGGESDTLVRGTDPDLRLRIRSAGYRIVVVPRTWAYHPMPQSLKRLLELWFSAGAGAADVFFTAPELVIDVPNSFDAPTTYRRTFRQRVADAAWCVIKSALRAQEIRFLCQSAYAFGYLQRIVQRKLAASNFR
jgi:glycosyltransferase involved in cell wall biosynthesis